MCDGEAILHVDRGQILIRSDVEGHDQVVRPVVRALRVHVEHAFCAVDLLFDRCGDRLHDDVRVGAGERRLDLNLRRDDLRILRDWKAEARQGAGERDDQRDDRREDRTVDEEVEHLTFLGSGRRRRRRHGDALRRRAFQGVLRHHRLHDCARSKFRDAVDDNDFVRIESLVDEPIAADPRLRDDLARRRLVVGPDDEHRLRSQQFRHGALRHAERIGVLARRHDDTNELSGAKRVLGIGNGDAYLQRSAPGIDGCVNEVEPASLRMVAAVDQLESKRRGTIR